MKGRRKRDTLFIFCLLVATLSVSWIFFTVLKDINLIFTELIYQFVFVISCLSLIISLVYIHEILDEAKSKMKKQKEKTKKHQRLLSVYSAS
jgi:ABC-type long-subunit fatty acid transport system fused permease/ATPase subunit